MSKEVTHDDQVLFPHSSIYSFTIRKGWKFYKLNLYQCFYVYLQMLDIVFFVFFLLWKVFFCLTKVSTVGSELPGPSVSLYVSVLTH